MRQLSNNLWGLIIAAIVAIAAVILIVWNFNPDESHWAVFVLLFAACLILFSAISIIIYYLVKSKKTEMEVGELMPEATKQGLIIGIVLTGLLILQSLHVLTWLNGLSIIIIAVILSMYFRQ